VTFSGALHASKRLYVWMSLLSAMVAYGLYGGYVVITQGLSVTGMSNAVVWGIWIAADYSFISLSAGAFAVSALIYIFRMERFRAVGRLAVFIGLIGYSITMLTLVLDVGRPERFWYPLLYWNDSSVLLEVFWCISLYAAVLLTEFVPSIAESSRLGRSKALAKVTAGLRWAMPALATAGVVFSTLHQSSLGALYGVLVARPLWNTEMMPLLFLLSAIPAGLSMTVIASMLTSRFMKREVASREVLAGLGKLAGLSLILYIPVYLWNYYILSTGPTSAALSAALAGTPYSYAPLVLELALGAVAPAVIFLVPRLRRSGKALFFGAALVVVGLLADRWDTTIMGQLANDLPPLNYVRGSDIPVFGIHLAGYMPTWPEWVTVAGTVSLGLLLFTLGVRFLKVLPSKAAS